MSFQALDYKERNFLNLVDDNNTKDDLWLKHFGHSNILYVRATRAIINHTPIGE